MGKFKVGDKVKLVNIERFREITNLINATKEDYIPIEGEVYTISMLGKYDGWKNSGCLVFSTVNHYKGWWPEECFELYEEKLTPATTKDNIVYKFTSGSSSYIGIINVTGYIYKKGSWYSGSYTRENFSKYSVEEATQEEINWWNACKAANKYISLEEANKPIVTTDTVGGSGIKEVKPIEEEKWKAGGYVRLKKDWGKYKKGDILTVYSNDHPYIKTFEPYNNNDKERCVLVKDTECEWIGMSKPIESSKYWQCTKSHLGFTIGRVYECQKRNEKGEWVCPKDDNGDIRNFLNYLLKDKFTLVTEKEYLNQRGVIITSTNPYTHYPIDHRLQYPMTPSHSIIVNKVMSNGKDVNYHQKPVIIAKRNTKRKLVTI